MQGGTSGQEGRSLSVYKTECYSKVLEAVDAAALGGDPDVWDVLDVEFEGESPIEAVRDDGEAGFEAVEFPVHRDGLICDVGIDEVDVDGVVEP